MTRKKQVRSLSDKDLADAHTAEHSPSQAQKWDAMTAADAPMVRDALWQAQVIREKGIDAGDAYLQGIADAHHALHRQALIDEVKGKVGSDSNKSAVDPTA